MKFGRCIESYVVTVYAVNDTGTIYNALRKFGTLEFVRCMGENVVNGVRSNEVRLYVFTYSSGVPPSFKLVNFISWITLFLPNNIDLDFSESTEPLSRL